MDHILPDTSYVSHFLMKDANATHRSEDWRIARPATDFLANRSLEEPYGYKDTHSPPPELGLTLLDDVSGASIPGLVNLYFSLGF